MKVEVVNGIKHLLRRAVNSRLGVVIFRWSIRYMSILIPTKKLYESKAVVAFYHPQPAYPTHILILPRVARDRFLDLTEMDDSLICEITHVAQRIVKKLSLDQHGYRLIVNGGEYQEIGQVHYHLISDVATDQTGL